MCSSDLWSVVGAAGADLRPEETAPGRPPVSLLKDLAVRCGFTESTFDVLVNDPKLVARVEEMLMSEFLSSVPADVIADAMGRPNAAASGSTHHLVVVHVPRTSEVNFEFSEPRGTWGWKDYRDHYSEIAPGDTILFALGFDGEIGRAHV